MLWFNYATEQKRRVFCYRGRSTVRRKSFGNARCPVARSLDEIGDWWTLLLVRDAFRGARRFSEFHKGLGLARNILAARLRQMVENGILEARPLPGRPGRHEYHLTEKGRRLHTVLVALRQWGEDNLYAEDEEVTALLDRQGGRAIGRLSVQAGDGRPLSPEDVLIEPRRYHRADFGS